MSTKTTIFKHDADMLRRKLGEIRSKAGELRSDWGWSSVKGKKAGEIVKKVNESLEILGQDCSKSGTSNSSGYRDVIEECQGLTPDELRDKVDYEVGIARIVKARRDRE